ncbi:hypothetical protein N9P82_00880 [bacterium]|jgi:hypothetical protein|nr:hypothetical protein [bacterium]|tara:strand:- start:4152 stop:4403 length:252 start_codon:yes stop_codon:yes gene_type:complete
MTLDAPRAEQVSCVQLHSRTYGDLGAGTPEFLWAKGAAEKVFSAAILRHPGIFHSFRTKPNNASAYQLVILQMMSCFSCALWP